jgi:DNA-binding MarR family transcriptional regulator
MSTTSSILGGIAEGSLEAGLGFRLGRGHRTVRGAWQGRIADLGLSAAQASSLRAVAERPGSGIRELARILGTDPMNAKRLADGLERAGLVRSCADPADRRVRVLNPTEAGVRLVREVEDRARAWTAALESMVGRDEIAALLGTLDRLEAGIAELAAAEGVDAVEHDRG